MNWKKSITISISAVSILLLARFAYSCIGGLVYYDYPSFFGNKATEKVAYRPFFYISEDLYYNNREDRNQDDADLLNAANIKEWQTYTKANILADDIDSVLNSFNLKDLINVSNGRQAIVAPAKKNNAFTRWLAANNSNGAANYLVYAKQCEPYVTANDWDTLTVNRAASEILINKGLAMVPKTGDNFLRLRYAFQIIRLAFYNKQYARTLALFDQLVGNAQEPSLTLARCIGFKAGVHYKQTKYAQAAYLYSKMFDASDGLKRTAMVSFVWSATSNDSLKNTVAAAMAFCKNNHERAVITVMQALREYNEALPLIQKAYQLDPAIKGIDVLVNREINKVEERYQTQKLYKENGPLYDRYARYYDQDQQDPQTLAEYKAYPAYLNRLNDFALQMTLDKENSSTAFWYLTSAYINYMLHNTKGMNGALQLANKFTMGNQEKQLNQILLLLYAIQNQPTITPGLEDELLPQLQALDKLSGQNSDAENNLKNIMNYLLAPKYLQQKDTAKALYCMLYSEREINGEGIGNSVVDQAFQDRPGVILDRMTITSLQGIEAFAANTNKTPFEAWLVLNNGYDKKALAELEGTKNLRMYNFKAAESIFATIPNLDKLPFPYEMRINDYEDTVYRQDTALLNNKYTFAKEMARLQDTIAKNPNNAPVLYKYALGLYGMSYYGRSPHLFTYYHGSSDEFKYFKTKERDKLPDVFQEYYGLYTAEKYFNLAEKAATTATLKAKCIYGAAKCWQKRCTAKNDDTDEGLSYVGYSLSNPYFKILRHDYGTNEFTKQVYSTCSYYRDYVKKKE